MNNTKNTLLIIALMFFCCTACNNNAVDKDISTDTLVIAKGETIFNQNCSGCHNFRQDAIGPQLSGVTASLGAGWLQHFIEYPERVIQSGDAHAQQLYTRYKVMMPAFNTLSADDINSVIAYLNTHKEIGEKHDDNKGNALSNPINDTIASSDLVANLQLFTQMPATSDSGKLPLARITKMAVQPQTNTLFIVDLNGKLYRMQNNKPVVYMNMQQLQPKFINVPGLATGFGSFAFHPDFAKNGLLYTTHTEPAGAAKANFSYADSIKVTLQWVLIEWKASNPAAATFSGEGRELLRVNMVSNIHGVQEISFNPLAHTGDEDYGLLYIGIGDGGAVENGYPFIAHSKNRIWGTVLRIDPKGNNSANHQYGIPATNPFVNQTDALGEVYAYGFRNPHRITWTRDGKMLVSNVGHGNIESLNLIEKGHDYGWPIREGTFVVNPYGALNNLYSLPANDSVYHVTYPVAEYDHDEGNAICGGYEYTGNNIPQLKGKFLFGDIPRGRLFYVNVNELQQGKQATIKEWHVAVNGEQKTLRQLCGSNRVDLHFGRDANGELYIMTKADGKVYKIVSAR